MDASAAFAAAERAFLDGDDESCERNATAAGELPGALRLRGLWRLRKGDPAAAIVWLERASAGAPGEPVFASDLGVAKRLAGDAQGAASEFRRAVAIDPGYAQAWHNLGLTLRALGDAAGAGAALERACETAPDAPACWQALGMVRREAGDVAGAAAAFEAVVRLAPEDATALANLGRVRWESGALAEAETLLRQAIALAPDLVAARSTLSSVLVGLGDVEGAAAEVETCARLDPNDAWTAQARVALENAADRLDGAKLRELAETWARLARPPGPRVHAPRPRPAKLRVGWMSPDFRRHSCAFFLEAPLAHRDRSRFEAIAFANFTHKRRPDSTTQALRAHFDEWHDASADDEARMAARIEAARIDVLVDLAGFSADTRFAVTMVKPAPVAVSWLGYAGTTGIAQIDRRIGDPIADPPANDPHFTERLLRLDGPFLAYDPRGPAPDPATNRVPVAGAIVFGSFNVSSKLNLATLSVWARILAQTPGAVLALKDNWAAKSRARPRIEALAAQAGLPLDRVRFFDYRLADADHLASYGRIDVALDPWPYNGTTTTCEALWMGVPVVTLAGGRHAARVGASLLTHAGFAQWVARDPDEYVRIALDLARDPARLRALRAEIRPKFAASPVCDPPGFARRFEAALDAMWDDFARGRLQGEKR